MRKILRSIGVALSSILLVAGALWATTGTWSYPVPTLQGLVTGDVIYAGDPSHLSNLSSVATGYLLASAGPGVPPVWSAAPPVTSLTASTYVSARNLRVPGTGTPTCATNCGASPSVVGSDSAGVITLGATPASAFILVFNAAWAAAPACIVQQQTSAANYVTKALTNTTTATISVAAGPTAADKFSYVCIGVQ